MSRRQIEERAAIVRYTRNILRVYRRATAAERREGAQWYAREAQRLCELAHQTGADVTGVIGAAAAISPGMKWELVPDYLQRMLESSEPHTVRVPTYSREFVRRAAMCLQGFAPSEVLSGPKVRAFFELLHQNGASDAVVIDGHALNIARGERATIRRNESNKIPPAGRVTAARYRRAAAAYRRAAEILGVAPHVVQATTWVHWRTNSVQGS